MNVRLASVEDAATIARIHVATWLATYRGIVPDAYLDTLDPVKSTEEWRGWLARPGRILVAEQEGVAVGFIAGGALREAIGEYDAELYALHVHHAGQRRGTGRLLVHKLAQQLLADGFRSMAVWMLCGNSAGRFYQRLGGVSLHSKQIEIAGTRLDAAAFGWPDLQTLLRV